MARERASQKMNEDNVFHCNLLSRADKASKKMQTDMAKKKSKNNKKVAVTKKKGNNEKGKTVVSEKGNKKKMGSKAVKMKLWKKKKMQLHQFSIILRKRKASSCWNFHGRVILMSNCLVS